MWTRIWIGTTLAGTPKFGTVWVTRCQQVNLALIPLCLVILRTASYRTWTHCGVKRRRLSLRFLCSSTIHQRDPDITMIQNPELWCTDTQVRLWPPFVVDELPSLIGSVNRRLTRANGVYHTALHATVCPVAQYALHISCKVSHLMPVGQIQNHRLLIKPEIKSRNPTLFDVILISRAWQVSPFLKPCGCTYSQGTVVLICSHPTQWTFLLMSWVFCETYKAPALPSVRTSQISFFTADVDKRSGFWVFDRVWSQYVPFLCWYEGILTFTSTCPSTNPDFAYGCNLNYFDMQHGFVLRSDHTRSGGTNNQMSRCQSSQLTRNQNGIGGLDMGKWPFPTATMWYDELAHRWALGPWGSCCFWRYVLRVHSLTIRGILTAQHRWIEPVLCIGCNDVRSLSLPDVEMAYGAWTPSDLTTMVRELSQIGVSVFRILTSEPSKLSSSMNYLIQWAQHNRFVDPTPLMWPNVIQYSCTS